MEESVKLTAKQEKVLDCIKKYQAEHGFPPAVREICEILGLSSPATVQSHINNLKKAGVIRNSSNKFRTIELLVENEYLNEQEGNSILNDCVEIKKILYSIVKKIKTS